MSLKYTLERFRWIKALFSPFTPFKVKWYVGKTQVGVPYFYPRKWVKATNRRATEATLEEIERQKKWNENNPNYACKIKSFEEIFQEKMKCSFAVPLKVGFSMCGLGWKTKWDEYDFRHEWNPIISFVFFGYQIAVTFYHPHHSHYWESWLCYEYRSDKKKSKHKRVNFCRRKHPQTWSSGSGEDKVTTDYWDLILKPKYQKKQQAQYK
jgi:hypothetical protein